jgi:hypothetical protein
VHRKIPQREPAETVRDTSPCASCGFAWATPNCAVSMWIRPGLDVRMVSELAGHVSPAFTLSGYSHVFETDVGHAAQVFAAYLDRADTTRRFEQFEG